MEVQLNIYRKGKDIPELPGNNAFHSTELFLIYEATPGYKPLLLVASVGGRPVAKLLAGVRRTKKWLPDFVSNQCVVYGTGEWIDSLPMPSRKQCEEVFGALLDRLVRIVSRSCFLIEFRNLESRMFGYRFFRDCGFSPVPWLRVRNSLHSVKRAEERFSASRIRQIKKGLHNGAVTSEAKTKIEIEAFARMLRNVYSARIRRYFPDKKFFAHLYDLLIQGQRGKIFIVKYKGKIIGGSVCIYSGEDAYLWFSGGMRKTYALQYPGVLSVWKAMEYAYQQGYKHLEFMDVGLPFRKHGYRDFVLRFGGKQSSTLRWFRFSWPWLNRLLVKIYV